MASSDGLCQLSPHSNGDADSRRDRDGAPYSDQYAHPDRNGNVYIN